MSEGQFLHIEVLVHVLAIPLFLSLTHAHTHTRMHARTHSKSKILSSTKYMQSVSSHNTKKQSEGQPNPPTKNNNQKHGRFSLEATAWPRG